MDMNTVPTAPKSVDANCPKVASRELVEVEQHRVHEVTAYHAQRHGEEHEHVRCVSVQRWR